jgi:hypothetical protein
VSDEFPTPRPRSANRRGQATERWGEGLFDAAASVVSVLPPAEARAFSPFVALGDRVADAHLGSWTEVEQEFLAAISAFDTEYSTGNHDSGWYQLKGKFFNDLVVDLVENCSGRHVGRRGKRPGTLFPHIDLDICYPADSHQPPRVAGESKIAGTPPHRGNKNVARPGSSDIDKRVREVAFNALDIKIAQAPAREQTIVDVADWIRRTDPRYFSFWAFRAENRTDYLRAVRRLDGLAGSYADGVGAFFYEPVAPDRPTTYRLVEAPDSMRMDRTISRLCRLIANSNDGS